jgi:hypothetical protein
MGYVPKVSLPLWLQSLMVGYLVPDDVFASTSISIGNFTEWKSREPSTERFVVLNYPGVIPDYFFDASVTPTSEGMSYSIHAHKSVGFWAAKIEISGYNPAEFNDWAFPIERRNFGYAATMVGNSVITSAPIHYDHQIVEAANVSTAVLFATLGHDKNMLTVKAESYCANRLAYTLYKRATARVSFLPVDEIWEVEWVDRPPVPTEKTKANCYLGDCGMLRADMSIMGPGDDCWNEYIGCLE